MMVKHTWILFSASPILAFTEPNAQCSLDSHQFGQLQFVMYVVRVRPPNYQVDMDCWVTNHILTFNNSTRLESILSFVRFMMRMRRRCDISQIRRREEVPSITRETHWPWHGWRPKVCSALGGFVVFLILPLNTTGFCLITWRLCHHSVPFR